MPLYDFKCSCCGNVVEVLQKINDSNPDVCMNCGACDTMERQIGKTSFQLKGDGWAKDLYHKPKK